MSDSTHDQALRNVQQQVLQRLLANMSQAQRASVQLLIQRLLVMAGGPGRIGRLRLFVLHGSDRRSAHLLASLRAAQLNLVLRYRDSFHLRILVARLPGLDAEALAAHDRCFDTLFLHHDPQVELLRADAGQVGPYSARPAASPAQFKAAGNAWLLFGHLCGGGPDALLGARGYLELAAVLDQALNAGEGVDAWCTAVPLRQRQRLMAWGRRCVREVTANAPSALPHGIGVLAEGLLPLHNLLGQALPMPGRKARFVQMVVVDDLLHLPHGERLEHMLGQVEAAPCAAQGPAGLFDLVPLAHLHGLHARHVQRRSYHAATSATFLRHNLWPASWPQGAQLQAQAQERLLDAYGVSGEHLVCQTFSPFAGHGRHLEAFVRRCHARMLPVLNYLHRALQGRPSASAVTDWLMHVSGLDMAQLRALYAGALRPQTRHLVLMLARRDAWLRALPDPEVAPADPARQAVY